MPVRFKNRREDPRSQIPGFQDAEIEFAAPDGATHKRPLIELSVGGGSFHMPERIPGLEVGAAVTGSVIRVAEFEIHVNLVIRRVTRADGRGYEYGVQFYTVNEQDRNEMAALIARLERYLQMV